MKGSFALALNRQLDDPKFKTKCSNSTLFPPSASVPYIVSTFCLTSGNERIVLIDCYREPSTMDRDKLNYERSDEGTLITGSPRLL